MKRNTLRGQRMNRKSKLAAKFPDKTEIRNFEVEGSKKSANKSLMREEEKTQSKNDEIPKKRILLKSATRSVNSFRNSEEKIKLKINSVKFSIQNPNVSEKINMPIKKKRGRPIGSKNSKKNVSKKTLLIPKVSEKIADKKKTKNVSKQCKNLKFAKRGRPSLKDRNILYIDLCKYKRNIDVSNSLHNLFYNVLNRFEEFKGQNNLKISVENDRKRHSNTFYDIATSLHKSDQSPETLIMAPIFNSLSLEWMKNVDVNVLMDKKPSYKQIVAKLCSGTSHDLDLLNSDELSMRIIRNLSRGQTDNFNDNDDQSNSDTMTSKDESFSGSRHKSGKLMDDNCIATQSRRSSSSSDPKGSNLIIERVCSPPRSKNESRQAFAPDLKALAHFLANSDNRNETFKHIRPPFSMSTLVYMAIVKVMAKESEDGKIFEKKKFEINNHLFSDTNQKNGVSIESICSWIGNEFEYYKLTGYDSEESSRGIKNPVKNTVFKLDNRSKRIRDAIIHTLQSNKCFQRVSKVSVGRGDIECRRRNLWKLDPTYSTISIFKQFYDSESGNERNGGEFGNQRYLNSNSGYEGDIAGNLRQGNAFDRSDEMAGSDAVGMPSLISDLHYISIPRSDSCFETFNKKYAADQTSKMNKKNSASLFSMRLNYIGDDYLTDFMYNEEQEDLQSLESERINKQVDQGEKIGYIDSCYQLEQQNPNPESDEHFTNKRTKSSSHDCHIENTSRYVSIFDALSDCCILPESSKDFAADHELQDPTNEFNCGGICEIVGDNHAMML
ncbi:MAG: hypothetical protein MHMPM18_001747 [Marteilia pararefringens]